MSARQAGTSAGLFAVATALLGGGCFNSTGSGPKDGGLGGIDAKPPGWTLQPIKASFEQVVFGTHYDAIFDAPSPTAVGSPVTFSWTIELTLVDSAGAPSPTNPGSGAAVDPACTNAGDGTSAPSVQTKSAAAHLDSTFTWFHPDPASSTPAGKYACDHTKEGPSGHQGLVTVVVSDGKWQCTAQYKGTNSSDATSVASGIASEPVCLRL
jgi:hypothetical protein